MWKNYYVESFETFLNGFNEVGYVEIVSHPILYIAGLPNAKPKEMVMFETGELGQIMSITSKYVEVLSFSVKAVKVGTKVARTDSILEVPVGETLLGEAINPFGFSIYESKPVPKKADFRSIESVSLDISFRERIDAPLETGVSLVDIMVPLGKGQRELIIGDRKTGKTEFLMQTMLSQAKKGTICIYAGIGRKKIDIKKVEDFLVKNGIVEQSIIVASSVSDPLGIIYMTPYTAMAIAEYFRDLGKDVLIILDDLTSHAKFYREISLISKRFPGRGSYPGDIFYTHSRLLERAGNFKLPNMAKPVSITCLPVAETSEGDISGYIQTNLMSITDGHLFFDKELFSHGRRPAINYFLSVTRVGRQTQSNVRWGINRELNSFLALLEKTQSFIHFGAEVNEGIKATLSMGDRIISFFDQPMDKVVPINLQIIFFSLIWLGLFKNETVDRIKFYVQISIEKYRAVPEFRKKIDTLADSSEDFNTLLGKLSSNQADMMSLFSI